MSLANGRSYLAIPGPSVMPDAVLRAMHRASPDIYGEEIFDMARGIVADLKAVAGTRHQATIYISNGHGAWEAALANTVAEGETVLGLMTGRFGHGWADMADGLGIHVEKLEFGKQSPVDLDQVEAALRADKAHEYKAVLVTHVDTSSSVRNDVAGLRQVLDAAGHPALLMVDCIASLGCDRYEMDEWGADVTVAASQKGLMTPPGLGFVFFNDKTGARRAQMPRVSRYMDWGPRARADQFYQLFGGTAPTHHLFALRAALDMIGAEGLEAVWSRHAHLARAIWAACDAWGQGGPLRLNIADPALRSHAVTALRIGAPDGSRLRLWLQENAGVTLGVGLGMAEPDDPAWHGFFRIGHMGHVNAHMVLGVLGAIDAGFKALDIAHGSGALEAATAVIAAA